MAAKKPDTRIVNRGRGHSYVLDGEPVPGVTTILRDGIPKPQLVGWAARTVAEYVADGLNVIKMGGVEHVVADNMVADIEARNAAATKPKAWKTRLPRTAIGWTLGGLPYADRDAAGNRGTEVHGIAEQLTHGEEVEVPEPIAGHVEAYVRFLDTWQPCDARTELVVVNRKWGYMGRLDMVADIDHPRLGRTLADIKTARSGVFGDVSLQLAGYRYAETTVDETGAEEPMPEVDNCAVIWVRADGYDVIPIDVTPEHHRVFLYAKQVGEALKRGEGFVDQSKQEALTPTTPPGATP